MHDLASCGDAEWIQCFDGYHNTEYDRPRNGWARAEAAADLPSPGRSAGTHKDIVADRDDYPSGGTHCRPTAANAPTARTCDADGCAGCRVYRRCPRYDSSLWNASRDLHFDTDGVVRNRLERTDPLHHGNPDRELTKTYVGRSRESSSSKQGDLVLARTNTSVAGCGKSSRTVATCGTHCDTIDQIGSGVCKRQRTVRGSLMLRRLQQGSHLKLTKKTNACETKM